ELCVRSTGGFSPEVKVFLQFVYKVQGKAVGQATVEAVRPKKNLFFYAKRFSSPKEDLSETGLALANPNNTAALITVTRRQRSSGTVLDSFTDVLPPFGHKAKWLNEMKPLPVADWEGTIEVESDLPIVGTVLQMTRDGQSFNFSTVPFSSAR
ncbi:MAG: hypothetical protein Q8Q92_01005, partial [bacterium]|nr:hypothetical protein [bacterium]